MEEFLLPSLLPPSPHFFCIYGTLIFLWETIPPSLPEHLFHMLLTPPWAWATSFREYLKDEHMIQQRANGNHAQGFRSNPWPQIILPSGGKRLPENGASLEESRVERCRETRACRSHGTQAGLKSELHWAFQPHIMTNSLFIWAACISSSLLYHGKRPVWCSQNRSITFTNVPY